MQLMIKRFSAALGFIGCSLAAQAQTLESCVPASEGRPFAVTAAKTNTQVKGVVMGRGSRAVVFSNTAYNTPCEWLPMARELVAKGYQVALWGYTSPGLEQIVEFGEVVAEMQRRGQSEPMPMATSC